MSTTTGPPPTFLNRATQRFYVRQRDARDRRRQSRIGLDTFEQDWQSLFLDTSPAGPQVERTIWTLWLQGFDQAPEMVRRCIQSWQVMNPGWRVEVLDEHRLKQFIDPAALTRRERSMNHLSDLIRLELLSRFGGVWVDATTICLRPLNDWIDRTQAADFFAFTKPQPLRSIASWFLAASPSSGLLQAMRAWCRIYLDSRRPPSSYFFFHHTFDWLLERDPQFRVEWQRCPAVTARGPHLIQRMLDDDLASSDQPSTRVMKDMPLFKLNRKKGYTISEIDAAMTHFGLSSLSEITYDA